MHLQNVMYPGDEDCVMRMLGLPEVPSDLLPEYEIRLNMFHRVGNSGPLGAIGLIDLLRGKGYRPASLERTIPPADWRDLPDDGSIRVEADQSATGDWLPGVYTGQIASGTIGVRLDGEGHIRECRGRDVRRAAAADSLSTAKPKQPAEHPVRPAGDPPDVNWAGVSAGAAVWHKEGDDLVDAKFQRVLADGNLQLRVDGKKVTALPDRVVYAGG